MKSSKLILSLTLSLSILLIGCEAKVTDNNTPAKQDPPQTAALSEPAPTLEEDKDMPVPESGKGIITRTEMVGDGDFQLIAGQIITAKELAEITGIDTKDTGLKYGVQMISDDKNLFYFIHVEETDAGLLTYKNNLIEVDLDQKKSRLAFETETTGAPYQIIGMDGDQLVMFDGLEEVKNCDSPWLFGETDVRGYKSVIPSSGTPETTDYTVPQTIKDLETKVMALCKDKS